MNLTNFLKQTDSLTEKYTAEQLRMFIHDVARVLPEGRREDFLKQLKGLDAAKKGEKKQREEKEQSFIEACKRSSFMRIRKISAECCKEPVISSIPVWIRKSIKEDWRLGKDFFLFKSPVSASMGMRIFQSGT